MAEDEAVETVETVEPEEPEGEIAPAGAADVEALKSIAAAKGAQILKDQVKLKKDLIGLIKLSGLAESETLVLLAKTENEINALTKSRLMLLEDERKKRIAMFTDTAREAALAALKERRDTVLAFADGAKEKMAIQKKFLEDVEKLNKEFDEKERGKEEKPTQPGAFREGTVEAFRAAFARNPLLDENKKQTKELAELNSSVDVIKRKVREPDDGGVGEMVITVG